MDRKPLDHPSFRDLVRVSVRIGVLSFGGPAGQIALMHRELVEERKWIGEDEYLGALNLCHLLPGPEAQQLATWAGWRLHGWKGGVAAGGLFVLPGAIVMLALSVLYAFAADLAWVEALFLGVKAAVLAIVLQALVRIGGRALKTPLQKMLAILAFIALFAFDVPFPAIVLVALVVGGVASAIRPGLLTTHAPPLAGPVAENAARQTIAAIATWGLIWAAPLAAVYLTLGPDHVLWRIGMFFSQLAVVTFGGAYAVLAYMAQEAVLTFGWLQPGEMVDGLGLAETTPGPLIMVTQFVGFLGAFRDPAPFTPLVAGILGAALTTWVTFAPCFLWIFAVAPWMQRIQGSRALRGALAGVTAAVVGVIANLSLWFAMHVLFQTVTASQWGWLTLQYPQWSSLDWRALVVAVVAGLAVFRFRWSIPKTLLLAAALGLALGSAF